MTTELTAADRDRVRQLLGDHWRDDLGFCVPNPDTYPHLWLWDSCFHAIIWAQLGDPRATRELAATLAGQLPSGFVPHMRYGATEHGWLGPLDRISSLTQPPMYAHAAKVLAGLGQAPAPGTLARARSGLDWLWRERRADNGLIFVVHPWEAGNDHSPRWDDFGAPGRTPADYSRPARTAWNKQKMHDVTFAADGAAAWTPDFVVCPAAFNAYVAFNLAELADLLGDDELAGRAAELGASIDDLLWDEDQQLWADLALAGGGPSVRIPTSDGVMGALVTTDPAKAAAALDQLDDPARFGAPYGPANVARDHPAYDPATYWRGPAWPPLNYLFWLAHRRWDRAESAAGLARQTLAGARASGWAEYWNPETGGGLGARPQSWTGLVIALRDPARDHPIAAPQPGSTGPRRSS
ncbi:MGH1-like glycoside hydrolase domain-containing protein [Microlunatus speluncae]|uniref:MGH1-like glycoside hydrolase domain-containing protein n=1 Tax=Microlunatus speluncae TaxID=2594267 RepID=UPI0015823CB1|nr:hypothetical protein [Microlunatus speluncae]